MNGISLNNPKDNNDSVDTAASQQPAQPSSPYQSSASQSKRSSKLPWIVAAIMGALLLILIMLVIALLAKKNDSASTQTSSSNTSSSQSAADNSSSQSSNDTIVARQQLNEKVELVVFAPKQNATNTTVNFELRNTCAGCSKRVYAANEMQYYNSKSRSFLLDDANGKKYSTILDQDDRVLSTPSCNDTLEGDEVSRCFVAFTKVPAGSTVSWVFGPTRIDNIKVE